LYIFSQECLLLFSSCKIIFTRCIRCASRWSKNFYFDIY